MEKATPITSLNNSMPPVLAPNNDRQLGSLPPPQMRVPQQNMHQQMLPSNNEMNPSVPQSMPTNPTYDTSSPIVQDILREIQNQERGPTQPVIDSPLPNTQIQHTLDPSVQPIPPQQNVNTGMAPTYSLGSGPQLVQAPNMSFFPKSSLTSNMVNELKSPVLVAVLFILLNFHNVHSFLMKSIPAVFSTENNNLSGWGTLFLGSLAAILYYLSKKFVLNL